jgi:hypothetical protein
MYRGLSLYQVVDGPKCRDPPGSDRLTTDLRSTPRGEEPDGDLRTTEVPGPELGWRHQAQRARPGKP